MSENEKPFENITNVVGYEDLESQMFGMNTEQDLEAIKNETAHPETIFEIDTSEQIKEDQTIATDEKTETKTDNPPPVKRDVKITEDDPIYLSAELEVLIHDLLITAVMCLLAYEFDFDKFGMSEYQTKTLTTIRAKIIQASGKEVSPESMYWKYLLLFNIPNFYLAFDSGKNKWSEKLGLSKPAPIQQTPVYNYPQQYEPEIVRPPVVRPPAPQPQRNPPRSMAKGYQKTPAEIRAKKGIDLEYKTDTRGRHKKTCATHQGDQCNCKPRN